MQFFKYHALGNDYLVLPKTENVQELLPEQIQTICHRYFGIGSDGILLEATASEKGNFALRIFNPDGSEAEKSGNGLRIFARYLFDRQIVGNESFTIETLGGKVSCQIICPNEAIIIDMGKMTFLKEGDFEIKGECYHFYAVSIGNPHCVVPCNEISEGLIRKIGPEIEVHRYFPNRTNVQAMEVIDGNTIKIEIWERGAGYTLASGSSAGAAAYVAYKMGKCKNTIIVEMPGGKLKIDILNNDHIVMTGPTTYIGEFILNNDLILKKNLHLAVETY